MGFKKSVIIRWFQNGAFYYCTVSSSVQKLEPKNTFFWEVPKKSSSFLPVFFFTVKRIRKFLTCLLDTNLSLNTYSDLDPDTSQTFRCERAHVFTVSKFLPVPTFTYCTGTGTYISKLEFVCRFLYLILRSSQAWPGAYTEKTTYRCYPR
jgi:hypothetical protein